MQCVLNAAQRAVQANADSPFTHYALASVYRTLSKDKEAIDELNKAASTAPSLDETYLQLGYVYVDLGQPAQAVRALAIGTTLTW
ncbi:MAG: hypothetical protein WA867_01675 [Candidatus Acidiferrales bacterium]